MKQPAAKRLVERIDEEIEKQSLLKHPFYQMWSEGKLSKEDLAGYAREYFQLVRTVPSLVDHKTLVVGLPSLPILNQLPILLKRTMRKKPCRTMAPVNSGLLFA